MFPVRVFGELEYIFGCFKLMFIILLIMMMCFLSIVQPRGEAYYHEPLGTRYGNHPYSFFNLVYNAKDENLKVEHSIEGSLGTLLGVW
ncbi:uncharacterized protein PODANS_5_5350 [Podospora anserina S mat+]|uniref:Amino acid transporter n=1 Tax=Podospora anserina (strain S / ATCC MYA-4624 / DSM 980 / FGSC 10383) TaxID=515849 RepID=B2VL93_PODAN|nr:uncharacterized protein PODANS_5_5350 [Podospora anserina S mat+]CAP49209.1 unnamed protein product [Podospora anserina S mat+]CDP29513.1 Putative amino acid transporter [Podospora anserina S mat+]